MNFSLCANMSGFCSDSHIFDTVVFGTPHDGCRRILLAVHPHVTTKLGLPLGYMFVQINSLLLQGFHCSSLDERLFTTHTVLYMQCPFFHL